MVKFRNVPLQFYANEVHYMNQGMVVRGESHTARVTRRIAPASRRIFTPAMSVERRGFSLRQRKRNEKGRTCSNGHCLDFRIKVRSRPTFLTRTAHHHFAAWPSHLYRGNCCSEKKATLHLAYARIMKQISIAHQKSGNNAHAPMVRGRWCKDVGVLLLNWDVLWPEDCGTEATSYWLCRAR
jgi:hypothetical protein